MEEQETINRQARTTSFVVLVCFTDKIHEDKWRARCSDFDITIYDVAYGRAHFRLREAIVNHIERAYELPKEKRHILLEKVVKHSWWRRALFDRWRPLSIYRKHTSSHLWEDPTNTKDVKYLIINYIQYVDSTDPIIYAY